MVRSDLDADDPRQLSLFELTPDDYDRPRTRGDCLPGGCNEQRPCPWVSCRHHLYLDVQRNGSIKLVHPNLEAWELVDSCTLDLIDKNERDQSAPQGCSLDQCAAALNLSPEHVRSLEALALASLRDALEDAGLDEDIDEAPCRAPAVVRVLRSARRGHATAVAIAGDTGLSITVTNLALSDLAELGEVRRTQVGRALRVELVRELQPAPRKGATTEADDNEDHR